MLSSRFLRKLAIANNVCATCFSQFTTKSIIANISSSSFSSTYSPVLIINLLTNSINLSFEIVANSFVTRCSWSTFGIKKSSPRFDKKSFSFPGGIVSNT